MKKALLNKSKMNSILARLIFLFCSIIAHVGYAQNAVSGFFNTKGQLEVAINFTYKTGKALFAGKEKIAFSHN